MKSGLRKRLQGIFMHLLSKPIRITSNLLEGNMRKGFRKVPAKGPGGFLMPLEVLKPIQRQDVVKQLSPAFPLNVLRR